ncbi:MAG: Holliday junction resolvase RuvX [Armatimonadota bacterium]
MKILGLDVGSRRIGVAVSELADVVVPVCVINRGPREMEQIAAMVRERGIELVVVGLPTGRSGEIGPQAQAVLEFVEALRGVLNVPVETWDESFTTAEAEEILIEADLSRAKRRKVLDAAAAVILLRSYLESVQPKCSRDN